MSCMRCTVRVSCKIPWPVMSGSDLVWKVSDATTAVLSSSASPDNNPTGSADQSIQCLEQHLMLHSTSIMVLDHTSAQLQNKLRSSGALQFLIVVCEGSIHPCISLSIQLKRDHQGRPYVLRPTTKVHWSLATQIR